MAAIKARHREADPANAALPKAGASAPSRTDLRGRAGEAIKFFTIDEVAEMLSVSTRTVRRWIDRGDLVAHRFSAAVRISEADLRACGASSSSPIGRGRR